MFIPALEQATNIVDKYGSPIYVTDAHVIKNKVSNILKAFSKFDFKIFYALKANFNPCIVKVIKGSGAYGINTISPNEIKLALKLGYKTKQIIFTPSNPSDEEIFYAGKLGVLQNLGSLSELKRFGENFPGQKVSIRICPEIGAGESSKVTTGQSESKFGISLEDISTVKDICSKYNLYMAGIHSHIGSGFYDPIAFMQSVKVVCDVAKEFSNISFLNFGGGFGVQYHPHKQDIDLSEYAKNIEGTINNFVKYNKKNIELRIEPGKFLVSQSTALLTKITTIKEKDGIVFVGVDSGFNNLIRPAMYGAYHHIVNISREDDKKLVRVVGNVCETCDIFNKEIEIANPHEGDILAILVAGGYGSSMSSNYNLREIVPEVLIDGNKVKLTRKKQTFEQIVENFIDYK